MPIALDEELLLQRKALFSNKDDESKIETRSPVQKEQVAMQRKGLFGLSSEDEEIMKRNKSEELYISRHLIETRNDESEVRGQSKIEGKLPDRQRRHNSPFRSIFQMRDLKSNDDESVASKASKKTLSRMLQDKRQKSIVYRQFCMDTSVLQVETINSIPKPRSPDDVVIKVQVRISWYTFSARYCHLSTSFNVFV
jgi:hypothetical protein